MTKYLLFSVAIEDFSYLKAPFNYNSTKFSNEWSMFCKRVIGAAQAEH